ncbi:DEAD/DEAH box helicase [Corynebacterium sp. 335C]
MANHLLHGLWLPGGGLHVWLERVEGHRVLGTAEPALAELPEAAALRLGGRVPRGRPAVTLQTPKGRRVRQPIPAWGFDPFTAAEVLAELEPHADHAAVAPDLRFLVDVAAGIRDLVRAGRVLVTVAWDDGEWYPRWKLADGLDEAAWRSATAAAAPPVLTVNGGPGFVDDMCEEMAHAVASRILHSDGGPTRVRHGFVSALLDSSPLHSAPAELAAKLARWRDSLGGRSVELVLEVEDPEGVHEDPRGMAGLVPGFAEAESAREEAEPAPDLSDLRWLVRLHYRTGVAAPVRVTPDMLRSGVRAQLQPLLAAALDAAPTLRTAEAEPGGCDLRLGLDDFMTFVSRDVPALEQAGVTVLLPAEWNPRATASVSVARGTVDRAPDGAGAGAHDLAAFDWRMSLDGEELSEAEMDLLLRSASPLVRMRGRWVRTRDTSLARVVGQLRRLAEFREELARRAEAGQDAGDDGAGSKAALLRELEEVRRALERERLDAEVLVDAGGDDALRRLMDGGVPPRPEPVAQPESVAATLRGYQLEGLAWLRWMSASGFGCILADDMGLGKTLQVLSLIALERGLREAAGEVTVVKHDAEDAGEREARDDGDPRGTAGEPRGDGGPGAAADPVAHGRPRNRPRVAATLVVAPLSGARNWVAEARRHTPDLRVVLHHGPDRAAGEKLRELAASADVVVTTYGVLGRDIADLASVEWDRVALDEAQNIKNPRARVSRAARALPSRHRLAMTGTPVENDLLELHSIMSFCNPGLLGTEKSFRTAFALPIQRDRSERAMEGLHRLIDPFILRRAKTDPGLLPELPDKTEHVVRVGLTREQAALYRARLDAFLEDLDNAQGIQRRALILAALTDFKQICNHPAHYLKDGSAILDGGMHRSTKVAELERLIGDAMAAGERTLVFTQYRRFGEMLLPYLRRRFGTDIPYLHGGVPAKRRQQMIDEFNGPDGPPVFLLSLQAGGTAITLTAANHVIHVDRWWNPAVENQATDRAFRIGQERDVTVHKLTTIGTLEERIAAIIDEKTDLADAVLGGRSGGAITELDDEAIASIVDLRAVVEERSAEREAAAAERIRAREAQELMSRELFDRIRADMRAEDARRARAEVDAGSAVDDAARPDSVGDDDTEEVDGR